MRSVNVGIRYEYVGIRSSNDLKGIIYDNVQLFSITGIRTAYFRSYSEILLRVPLGNLVDFARVHYSFAC